MEAIIGGVVGFVVGVVATPVVTSLVSGTGTVLRGVTKEVIKGGIMIQEGASNLFSGTGGYFSDIVTEAKNELAKPAAGETVRPVVS
ncbi:MAG: hypothetical protein CV088_21790 [Nitrospira sp. LK70]|nr:hypothetical protein [Nitrospira sp. LK70]